MHRVMSRASLASVLLLMAAAGCSTAPKTTAERSKLESEAEQQVALARTTDPSIQPFFDKSAGYAVFPTIGKGGLLVGGAYGKGVLYEKGHPVAFCDMTQASAGLQLGGQAYTEFIFFETPQALADFKTGDYTLAAQATAVVLKSAAATNAKYSNSVAVFTTDESGLMGEAVLAGQKFNLAPTDQMNDQRPTDQRPTMDKRPADQRPMMDQSPTNQRPMMDSSPTDKRPMIDQGPADQRPMGQPPSDKPMMDRSPSDQPMMDKQPTTNPSPMSTPPTDQGSSMEH